MGGHNKKDHTTRTFLGGIDSLVGSQITYAKHLVTKPSIGIKWVGFG